ncbi:MAG: GNAT family N-acetyltransferase [Eggerthellaceae bacterium]|nr:GNAT family N-acetyltransferase [Eggerthellaceae bacterium]
MTSIANTFEVRSLTKRDPAYEQVCALYKEAFPFEERFSLLTLRFAARKKEVDFLAYFSVDASAEQLVGMTYTIAAGDYLYILYLAVCKEFRGGGWGTRILDYLKQQFPGKQLVLEIEPLDKAADNYEQRLSRLGFYERNGFSRVGYDFFEGKVRYTVLATGDSFDADAFSRALRKLSHGLYRFKILPASD